MANSKASGQRIFLQCAVLSGFICIALGAFGAHALKASLSHDAMAIWQTAVQYQMFQTLALLGVALLMGGSSAQTSRQGLLKITGYLFILGIALFSGSLYLLALTGVRWLGAITPLGGASFLAGWALLFWHSMRAASVSD